MHPVRYCFRAIAVAAALGFLIAGRAQAAEARAEIVWAGKTPRLELTVRADAVPEGL